MKLLRFNHYLLMDQPPTGTPAVTCPMCAFAHRHADQLGTRYCTLMHPDDKPKTDSSTYGELPEPHLHRTCGNCSYEWLEETAQAKQTGKHDDKEDARRFT